MPPNGDRLIPGSPQGVPAGRAPLIDMTASYGPAGIECFTVTVVWDEQARVKRDYLRIYRDGAVRHERARERPATETVGRDEDAHPICGGVVGQSRRFSVYCGLTRGHDGPCGDWRVHEREQDGDERSDPAA